MVWYNTIFNSPTLCAGGRLARLRSPPAAQSEGRNVYYVKFFGSPKKISTEEGLILWTDRNFVEILGKLCFARLKLKTKLG